MWPDRTEQELRLTRWGGAVQLGRLSRKCKAWEFRDSDLFVLLEGSLGVVHDNRTVGFAVRFVNSSELLTTPAAHDRQ